MAEHQGDVCILDRLEKIEGHVRRMMEAGRANEWQKAELALRDAQIALQAATRYVQMANDIQRGQIR